jgi:hypothetical protein
MPCRVARHIEILAYRDMGRSKAWSLRCLDTLVIRGPLFLDFRPPRSIVKQGPSVFRHLGFNRSPGTSIPRLLQRPDIKVAGHPANKVSSVPRLQHRRAGVANLIPSSHRPTWTLVLMGGLSGLIHTLDRPIDDPGSNLTISPTCRIRHGSQVSHPPRPRQSIDPPDTLVSRRSMHGSRQGSPGRLRPRYPNNLDIQEARVPRKPGSWLFLVARLT